MSKYVRSVFKSYTQKEEKQNQDKTWHACLQECGKGPIKVHTCVFESYISIIFNSI